MRLQEHVCSILRLVPGCLSACLRLVASVLLPARLDPWRQAARLTAQSDALKKQLLNHKHAARHANAHSSRKAQRLHKALHDIICLQRTQQQLQQTIMVLSGDKQQNNLTKRTLKRTAKHCKHLRAKVAEYRQSASHALSLSSVCDDLRNQVFELAATVTATREEAFQQSFCKEIAKRDIAALHRFNQQQTTLTQCLQQQLVCSEAQNSKLVKANLRLRAMAERGCSDSFSLHRVLAKVRSAAAELQGQLSQASLSAACAESAKQELAGSLGASQAEAAALKLQLLQADARAADADSTKHELATSLGVSQAEAADLKLQLCQADSTAANAKRAKQKVETSLGASRAEAADLKLQLSQIRLVQVGSCV